MYNGILKVGKEFRIRKTNGTWVTATFKAHVIRTWGQTRRMTH